MADNIAIMIINMSSHCHHKHQLTIVSNVCMQWTSATTPACAPLPPCLSLQGPSERGGPSHACPVHVKPRRLGVSRHSATIWSRTAQLARGRVTLCQLFAGDVAAHMLLQHLSRGHLLMCSACTQYISTSSGVVLLLCEIHVFKLQNHH